MDYFGIFAKHWQPGKVKTRLARSIGDQSAATAYHQLLTHLVSSLSGVGQRRVIAYSPPDKLDAFESFVTEIDFKNNETRASQENELAWGFTPQADGDLGQRMSLFFQNAFADSVDSAGSATRVLLIGSDCPEVTPEICQNAFAALDDHDVVLGPTEDGGYYLVGMSGKFHDVFGEITFSTTSVLQDTIDKMTRDGVSYFKLKPLNDIDEIDDLERFMKTLHQQCQSGSATLAQQSLHQKLQQCASGGEPS